MIISASRRTDIPAFYAEWFMNRLRAEHLLVRNPFNAKQVKRVSLAAADVDAIVFWTRNMGPLLPHLPEIDRLGYVYYVQYTITGYPRALERSVPHPTTAIETFQRLAGAIGAERVLWRYDPILLSSLTDLNEHRRLFAKIAAMLSGHTRRVTISYADFYRKTERNLKAVDGLVCRDLVTDPEALLDLARFMADVAHAEGMEIQTCSERIDLADQGIGHGKCIDDVLIRRLFGRQVGSGKDCNQREECGCVKSLDIGSYDTCLHGCAYCYATAKKELAKRNAGRHDPLSPFLVGAPPQPGEPGWEDPPRLL